MDLNINHLRILRSVAEAGSISGGAERLMISQPAVSKQLAALESAVNLGLVERLPRGVRLTHAGAVLADYARRIAAVEEQAKQAVMELQGGSRGSLRVGASTTISVYLLPEAVVTFRRKHAGVQVHLTVGPSAQIAKLIPEGELDVGFTEAAPTDPSLDSEVFREDELVAIAAPSHPTARKRTMTVDQLCAEPFVVRDTGSDTKSYVERALTEGGISVNPVLSVGSTEAVKRAVAAGLGVAIVSKLAIELEVEAKRLKVLRVNGLKIRRPLYRVKRKSSPDIPAVKEFEALLSASPG